jgi:hypothetical protein
MIADTRLELEVADKVQRGAISWLDLISAFIGH